LASFVVIQELKQLSQFFFRGFSRRERANQERLGRSAEGALELSAGKLPLRPRSRLHGFVNMSALLLIAAAGPCWP